MGTGETFDLVTSIMDICGSMTLLIFFVSQYRKSRCKWEVIFVMFMGMLVDIIGLIGRERGWNPVTISPKGTDKQVPWMRYCGWLITCPVLLIHLSNLTGEEVWNIMRMMKLVLLDQVMIMFGSSAAMAEGSASFGLYLIGVMSFTAILKIVVHIFNECMSVFPEEAHDHLVTMVSTFVLSWASFGVLWHFGPEGWGVWDKYWSNGMIHIADIVSKQIYCYMGWHLRWKILRKAEKKNKLELKGGGNEAQHNVLVLEDDDVMVSLFHIKLRHHKCDIDSCKTVAELVTIVENTPDEFDFVLANFDIVRQNNYELMYKMRRTGSILPVVAYSRIFTPDEINQMMRSGVDDYLEAPFPEDDIKQVLKRWHKPKRELRGSLDKHADEGAPPAKGKGKGGPAPPAGKTSRDEPSDRELGMKMARRLSQSSTPDLGGMPGDRRISHERVSFDLQGGPPAGMVSAHNTPHMMMGGAPPAAAGGQSELEKQQLGGILSMMQKQMMQMQNTMVMMTTNPEAAKQQMAAMGSPDGTAPPASPPAHSPVPSQQSPMPSPAHPAAGSPAPGGAPAAGYARQNSGSQNSWYEMMI